MSKNYRIRKKGYELVIFEDCIESPREYYKDDKKYLEYWEKEKRLCGDDDVPLIEIYDLSKRFEEDINYIFPLVL